MNKKIISIVLGLIFLSSFAIFGEEVATLTTLFNLLPEKTLKPTPKSFNLDVTRREAYIEVYDEENGYLSLKKEYNFEMCYWNLKGGKKLVLISYGGLAPELFYLYNKGKLSQTDDFGIKELRGYVKKSVALKGVSDLIHFYPPRYGTSLVVMINQIDCMIFKWKNEKFVHLNDYVAKKTYDDIYNVLLTGFVKALNSYDVASCLQYVKPDYIALQCMDMFNGMTEQFICELIAGQDADSEYVRVNSLKDIKKATCNLNPNTVDGMRFIITIELIDGSTYMYFPEFEEVEVDGSTIVYLVGAMG